MPEILIAVKSSRAAIHIDNYCAECAIKCKTISTPENISSECGISLLIDSGNIDIVKDFISDNNLECKFYDRFA